MPINIRLVLLVLYLLEITISKHILHHTVSYTMTHMYALVELARYLANEMHEVCRHQMQTGS